MGKGADEIITCFQTGLQLVKELGGDDLKHDVEEVEVRQPGDQHQRLEGRVTTWSHDIMAQTPRCEQVQLSPTNLLKVSSFHRHILHLSEVDVAKEMGRLRLET